MKVLRCLIVDDEPLAQRVIEKFARDLSFLDIVRKCGNAMEAREKLSGLSFMRSLRHPPLVIFTTAYADHALESYELEAVDYLKKPFSFERFSLAVEKVQRRLEGTGSAAPFPESESVTVLTEIGEPQSAGNALDSHLFVKTEGAMVRLDLEDIVLIESMGDYVKVVRRNGILLSHETMQQWESRLPSPAFLRVHKSFIVPDSIKAKELTIRGRTIAIGRVYRAALDAVTGGV